MNTLPITKKEAEKVNHDINNVWHARYSSQVGNKCVIATHSHKQDSPSFEYHFINHAFSNYEYVAKYPTIDRR